MKKSTGGIYWSSLRVAIMATLLSLWLACGPGEAPTPTPASAVEPVASPTPTPASAVGPVATPTPTSAAALIPTPTPGEQPVRGGKFVVATQAQPNSYDPQLEFSVGSYQYSSKLYNNLLAIYVGDKVECELCTGWRIENGGKTWVFDLIRGVKFQDGRELTAEDIKYSLDFMMGTVDGITSVRSGIIKEFIDSVEATSKYEVRINLFSPTTLQNKVLATGPSAIYPKGTTRAELKTKPHGSGPFLLRENVAGAGYKLERNPTYFKPGLPYLDAMEIQAVTDSTALYALFLTGKSKYFYGPTAVGFKNRIQQFLPTLEKMVDEGKINSFTVPGGCGPEAIWFNNSKPPFDDINLRKAFNLVFDRKEMSKVMHGIYGQPGLMGYSPGMPFATPPEQIWDVVPGWGTGAKKQQEIQEAKQILNRAGYPEGLNVTQFAGGSPSSTGYGAAVEPYMQALKQIGVNVTLQVVSNIAERRVKLNYTYELYVYCVSTQQPDELIGQYWITGGARNPTGYSNPEVDKLYFQMATESDPAKKRELFFKIQDIIVVKDVAYGPVPHSDSIVFWWRDVGGFSVGMTTWSPAGAHRFDRVWLKSS